MEIALFSTKLKISLAHWQLRAWCQPGIQIAIVIPSGIQIVIVIPSGIQIAIVIPVNLAKGYIILDKYGFVMWVMWLKALSLLVMSLSINKQFGFFIVLQNEESFQGKLYIGVPCKQACISQL